MADINESLEQSIAVTQSVVPLVLPAPYCSVDFANLYFLSCLGTAPWDDASDADKEKALLRATILIDRLNYAGEKTDADQRRQFPRGGDTVIPESIKFSACHIALALLDGIDPEMEIANSSVLQHKIGPINTNYDRSRIADHIKAGIPSLEAWRYLYPYLRQMDSVRLSRNS